MPTEGLAGEASSRGFPDEDLSARSQHGDNCYLLCLLVYISNPWGGHRIGLIRVMVQFLS